MGRSKLASGGGRGGRGAGGAGDMAARPDVRDMSPGGCHQGGGWVGIRPRDPGVGSGVGVGYNRKGTTATAPTATTAFGRPSRRPRATCAHMGDISNFGPGVGCHENVVGVCMCGWTMWPVWQMQQQQQPDKIFISRLFDPFRAFDMCVGCVYCCGCQVSGGC